MDCMGALHGSIKHFGGTGSVIPRTCSGRRKVTTPSEYQYIKLSWKTKQQDIEFAEKRMQDLANVKRRLSCSDFWGRGAVSQPLLRHRKRPNSWDGVRNTSITQWMTCIPGLLFQTAVKHSAGNIHVSGKFTYSGHANWLTHRHHHFVRVRVRLIQAPFFYIIIFFYNYIYIYICFLRIQNRLHIWCSLHFKWIINHCKTCEFPLSSISTRKWED